MDGLNPWNVALVAPCCFSVAARATHSHSMIKTLTTLMVYATSPLRVRSIILIAQGLTMPVHARPDQSAADISSRKKFH